MQKGRERKPRLTFIALIQKRFPTLAKLPHEILEERLNGKRPDIMPANQRILNRSTALFEANPQGLRANDHMRRAMNIAALGLVDEEVGIKLFERLINSITVDKGEAIKSITEGLVEVALRATSENLRRSAIENARILIFHLSYSDKESLGAQLERAENQLEGRDHKEEETSVAADQSVEITAPPEPLIKDTERFENGPLVRGTPEDVNISDQPSNDLPSAAGQIDHNDAQADRSIRSSEPAIVVRDSVFLDVHAHLRKEVLAAYESLQGTRERYKELNNQYWILVNKYDSGNAQVDYDAVREAYDSLRSEFANLELMGNIYKAKLKELESSSGMDSDAVERSLLGEEVYRKEIEYRLSNAREQVVEARQKKDEDSIPQAEKTAWRLEDILRKLDDVPLVQDSIVETDFSLGKSTFVASAEQEQLEMAAAEQLIKTIEANEEGVRLEEYINAGGTVKPQYTSIMESRIRQRAQYKKALDQLSAKYNGTDFERVHELVEKRIKYDKAQLSLLSAFGAEIDYNSILDLGKEAIDSGRYKTSAAHSKDRIAADFFHASFELNHARELLLHAPLRSVTLDNGTMELRDPQINVRNTIWCFNDMVEHIQSKPPTPQQLAELIELRKGQEHYKNKILNTSMWFKMSSYFGRGNGPLQSPIVVTVPQDLPLMRGDGLYTSSHYFAIKQNSELSNDDRSAIIAHEQAHYLAALNGGLGVVTDDGKMDMRWQVGARKMNGAAWLHEGLTELLTQQIIRSSGINSKMVGYSREVILCHYLQMVVGRDILEKAYLSGDFTKVKNKLDGSLGHGTFEELLSKRMTLMADIFLTKVLEHNGIDYRSWEDNEIIRIARKQLEQN
jgi:hypothetical protein